MHRNDQITMKQSQQTIALPTVHINNAPPQLPNVTYNIGISEREVVPLLDAFIATPSVLSHNILELISKVRENIKTESPPSGGGTDRSLSHSMRDGVNFINKNYSSSNRVGSNVVNFPVIACLHDTSNVAIISKVVRISITEGNCVLGLKGECRGAVVNLGDGKHSEESTTHTSTGPLSGVQFDYIGEVKFEVTIGDEDVGLISEEDKQLVCDAIDENLREILKFVKSYSSMDNTDLESTLTKLTPLAELLFLQLNEDITLRNLKMLHGLMKGVKGGSLSEILAFCDIYVAVFPFTSTQCKRMLEELNVVERLSIVHDLTQFVNTLFTVHLNMDYLVGAWERLGKLGNGKALQSRFIANHFKNLKQLLEHSQPGENGYVPPQGSALSKNSGVEDEDNDLAVIAQFIHKIDDYKISKDGKTLLTKDFKRLKKMQSTSSEYQQLRNYFDIVMDIPWPKLSESNESYDINLAEAQEILDRDHYGMDAVKERIHEYLTIMKLTKRQQRTKTSNEEGTKAPILLLDGPPGVGKTSLAKSVARSLNCEFQRVSLGGVNDFADIKGHRRTYVGAFPGLIIQALRRAKSTKLVILLDEIDSISASGGGNGSARGNPEAALLELLDPEQNHNFTDHYIGFPVDLSNIVFIGTSNDQWRLSDPLRDRMEIIELSGYNYKEKVKIAQQFILPRQRARNELRDTDVVISDGVLQEIAMKYTHEAGIRNLERLIGKICRKKAVELLMMGDDVKTASNYSNVVEKIALIRYLGIPASFSDTEKYTSEDSVIQESYGLVNGLSYNSDGSGSLLKFEMVGTPGSQNITTTGSLGNVLMESCEIAKTVVGHLIHTHTISGYNEKELVERLESTNVHMHVPEGAIRKDGPSAGLTMTLCYLSLIMKRPVDPSFAMTGEITLTSKALRIGGLREKLLGASLTGKVKCVLAPRLNRTDLISAYIDTITDREESKFVLTRLVLEEEECLSQPTKRYSFSGEVESWVKEEFGLEIRYVDDFTDVIREVWNGQLTLKRKELIALL